MDSNTIEIDKEASELVKLIYCLYLYGFSINEIRTIMDDSKYETPYEHKRRYNKNYCSNSINYNVEAIHSKIYAHSRSYTEKQGDKLNRLFYKKALSWQYRFVVTINQCLCKDFIL